MSQLLFSRVSIQPSTEPITKDELKAQLNIDPAYVSEDTYIDSLIKAARNWIELRIGQSIISQTRVQTLDYFPSNQNYIPLLYGPIISVTSVTYYDANDAQQTLNASTYWTNLNKVEPNITAKNTWPSVGNRPGGVDITYVAGMALVPEAIKQAMNLLCSHFYQNRVPEVQGNTISKLDFALETLLGPYVVIQNSVIC